MPTYRIKKDKDNPYLVVNKAFIYDKRLSFKAKGIMAYLMSRPDDWQVYESEIVKHAQDGRDSVRTGIRQLITCDYIQRTHCKDPTTGRFTHYEYIVHEVSPTAPKINAQLSQYLVVSDSPTLENPSLDEVVENQGVIAPLKIVSNKVRSFQQFIKDRKSSLSTPFEENCKRIRELEG